MPVRDEADIIGQCLRALLAWADVIVVFDTGSVDDTWEIVQAMAFTEKRIIPLRKDPVHFHDSTVRGWLFHKARGMMREGDWFLRVDADEFHHIPPPEFVKEKLRSHETVVYHQYFNFVLRESEAREWMAGTETIADRSRPIEDRRQWYQPSLYSEPRMCRYRATMQWSSTVSFPYNAGYLAMNRLPIRHYPHRDPVQLDRRCKIRAWMIAQRGDQLFTGYDAADIARARSLFQMTDIAKSLGNEWRRFITPTTIDGLQQWQPGIELPDPHYMNHLASAPRRLAQFLTHRFLLPYLDARRNGWRETDYPEQISPVLVAELSRFLQSNPALIEA